MRDGAELTASALAARVSMMSWRKATRAMAGRGLASAQSAYALMGAVSRFQFKMACHHLRGYADR